MENTADYMVNTFINIHKKYNSLKLLSSYVDHADNIVVYYGTNKTCKELQAMSVFFDFEVGPKGRRFRKAVDADKYDIELFWKKEETYPLYGEVDIGALIELSCLSICMINRNMDVIGFMSLSDHPNIPSVDPAGWEHWIRNMFQKYFMSRNTLFIHFMCCIDEALGFFMQEAIISIFLNDSYLLQIVLVVPPECPENAFHKYHCFKRHNIFRYTPRCDIETEECGHFLYTCLRKEFVPKLRIRRAVEEDNDDIVAIIEKQTPKLKEMYGDYYISEIIGRRPETRRRVIVIDTTERASISGVMCLNPDVNYKKLQQTYELKPYYGLMKATPLEKEQQKRSNVLLTKFGEPIMRGKWSVFDRAGKLETEDSDDDSYKETIISKASRKKTSKVNFRTNTAMRHSFVSFYRHDVASDEFSDKTFPETPSLTDTVLLEYVLDDDPFDYEFVNIDDTWLTVPEVDMQEPLVNRVPTTSSNMQCKVNHRSSVLPSITKDETVKYTGQPNAFMIELYGLTDDIDERQAFDLLEVAFETMKVYDYCVIRVPCHEKRFPLLQHFCFVPTKNGICCEYALYVAHRSSVLNKMLVRKAELIDVPRIAQLLQNLEARETLWTVENYIFNKRQHNAYVFMSGLSLVGIGILEAPEQVNFIRAKFNMAPYHMNKYHYTGHGIDTGFATLKLVIIYPVFEAHFKYFTREMMRLSGSSNLIWMTAYRNKWVTHKANSLTSSMVPLMPRLFQLERSNIPELKKLRRLASRTVSFSTWFIGKKLTSIPKVNVDSRIVVVGASRTAMSFLNTLLFSDTSTYLTFNSVTLVSPEGLPYSRHSNEIAETMFNKFYGHTEKYLKSVPYTYYVNVVSATLVEINKKQKYIGLDNGGKYYYDLLFLLFGKQYQHPNYLKPVMDVENDYKLGITLPYVRLDVPNRSNMYDKLVDDAVPNNVFIINHISHANKAISYVQALQARIYDYKIIIYGSTINAYCCLATLLDMLIPPSHITFVEPFPSEDPTKPRVPVFSNVYVDESMREILERKKLKVYRSHYFQSWTLDYANNVVTSIDFISHFKLTKLECDMFFYYGKRGVNTQAFVAINKSGMAYDGGILIDHEFRTKDPSIYAAGPATRYFMRYWADSKRHKYYDGFEVGKKLGEQIRNQLDPLFTEQKSRKHRPTKLVSFDRDAEFGSFGDNLDNTTPETIRDLPELFNPKVIHCRLPGGLQYLEVKPPGMRQPHQYIQALQYNGIVMETFKTGYFKIHLTHDLFVDGITCLCFGKVSLENFKHLYGKPSTVLNNVHLRFSANKIDNFYEFFELPWAIYLYHDQTDELFTMVKEILPKGQRKGETITEVLRSVCEGLICGPSTADTKLKIYSKFEKTPHIEAITDYVMAWLSETDVLLPVYMQPKHRGEFTRDIDNNPLFLKRKKNVISLLKVIL